MKKMSFSGMKIVFAPLIIFMQICSAQDYYADALIDMRKTAMLLSAEYQITPALLKAGIPNKKGERMDR